MVMNLSIILGRVLPEVAENGTTVTGTKGIYATPLSPTKQASFSLAAGFERFSPLATLGIATKK